MYLLRASTILFALALSSTKAFAGVAPIQAKADTSLATTPTVTTTVTASPSLSLTYDPTNSAILIPASYPITGLTPQCNSYETVQVTDANKIQNSILNGQVIGGCCTTARKDCSLLNVNNTAAVQLCSTGGSQCAHCTDLAVAMKAIVTSCSATLLSSSLLVGGQVVVPWMVNTTLQINPAQGNIAFSGSSRVPSL